MIPKIAHFYWGNKTLPFLRYLTIWSFCKHNPDWEVRFYYPKKRTSGQSWPTHEHKYQVSGIDSLPLLQRLPVKQIEIDFSTLLMNDDMSEVHKSDFLRWHILSTEGGLWSDMDILYFKGINLNLNFDTYFCINPQYGHSIGLLLSSPGSGVFHFIKQEALAHFNPNNYQSMGSIILNRLYPIGTHGNFYNIPMDIIYAYNALTIPEIFAEDPGKQLLFTDRSIGLHWYAGHQLAGKYINLINVNNFNSFNSVLGQALRMATGGNYGNVIAGEEGK